LALFERGSERARSPASTAFVGLIRINFERILIDILANRCELVRLCTLTITNNWDNVAGREAKSDEEGKGVSTGIGLCWLDILQHRQLR
jgi:hypothetical protein